MVGATLLDARGAAIGTLGRTYHRGVRDPEYAQVDLGFGPTLVPVADARPRDDVVEVNVTVDQIRDAPYVDARRDLDPADLAALRDYYREIGEGADPRGADVGEGEEVVSLPPRGQEKVILSEGPDDRPPTR